MARWWELFIEWRHNWYNEALINTASDSKYHLPPPFAEAQPPLMAI